MEINRKCIEPLWWHGVALPNLFFTRDHVDKIQFPTGRTLHHAKDPYWFNIVCNYIHSSQGMSFYADLYWLQWQHESNCPSVEASHLWTELFELKGGSGSLNLSVEDLRLEHDHNPEYMDKWTAKINILISRWVPPLTPQSWECRKYQWESQPQLHQWDLLAANWFPHSGIMMAPWPQWHHQDCASSWASTSVGEDSIMEEAKTMFHKVDNTLYYTSDAGEEIELILNKPSPSSSIHPKCIKDA